MKNEIWELDISSNDAKEKNSLMMELNPKAQAIAIYFTNPANLETCNLNIIWMAPNLYVISRFCHEVDENCTLRAYYTASSGNFLPTFQGNVSIPPFLDMTFEDAIDMLS
jgi:hypothetical protein